MEILLRILILQLKWLSTRCRIRLLLIWRNRWLIWLCMLVSSRGLLIRLMQRLLIFKPWISLFPISRKLGSKFRLIRMSCRLFKRSLLMLIVRFRVWMILLMIFRLMPVRQLFILILTFYPKVRLSCWIMCLIWA